MKSSWDFRPRNGRDIWMALSGMTVAEVLRQLLAGIEEEGLQSRLVRVYRSIDLGLIGWTAARLSGSGVSVGLQAKGTALIHRGDLPPLGNLELFSIAPRITPELYRRLGRNAARYAEGWRPSRCYFRSRASRWDPDITRGSFSSSPSNAGGWRMPSRSSWRRHGRVELSAGGRRA